MLAESLLFGGAAMRTIWILATCGALACAALTGCKQTPHSLATARSCLQKKDLPCAEANLRGYLERYPHDYLDTARLAVMLSQEGKHADAEDYAKTAIDGGVNDYELYANYAISLEATGDVAGAMAQNRKALALNPALADVAATLTRQLVQAGKLDEALSVLTSFDATQQARGHPPHFTDQIASIRQKMGTAAPGETSAAPAVAAPAGTP